MPPGMIARFRATRLTATVDPPDVTAGVPARTLDPTRTSALAGPLLFHRPVRGRCRMSLVANLDALSVKPARRRSLSQRLVGVLVIAGIVGVLAAIAVPLYANV
jgi:hypothetical protein